MAVMHVAVQQWMWTMLWLPIALTQPQYQQVFLSSVCCSDVSNAVLNAAHAQCQDCIWKQRLRLVALALFKVSYVFKSRLECS